MCAPHEQFLKIDPDKNSLPAPQNTSLIRKLQK